MSVRCPKQRVSFMFQKRIKTQIFSGPLPILGTNNQKMTSKPTIMFSRISQTTPRPSIHNHSTLTFAGGRTRFHVSRRTRGAESRCWATQRVRQVGIQQIGNRKFGWRRPLRRSEVTTKKPKARCADDATSIEPHVFRIRVSDVPVEQ